MVRLEKDGVVKGPGFLDDHAYLVNAALDLYEVTGEPRRVALARRVADAALAAFHEDGEGLYFTPKDGQTLISRQKDPFDQAVPSGFSMMCRGLLRLGHGGVIATVANASLWGYELHKDRAQLRWRGRL